MKPTFHQWMAATKAKAEAIRSSIRVAAHYDLTGDSVKRTAKACGVTVTFAEAAIIVYSTRRRMRLYRERSRDRMPPRLKK